MVSSDLGACEWFVWDLRRSGLIDRGQLDQVVGDFLKRNPRAEPPALAEYLVGQGVLSAFQAERILSGKTQGMVLGPYVLADSIGQGSMGTVYKATSKTDANKYAVKVLPRRSMWNVRLARRQVRAFSQFTDPTVVPFIDVGTAGGQHYLVWPLVDGESLEARIQRDGRLSVEAASLVGSQIAKGLAIAHQHGLFHGLLKPSNIMIGTDGHAKILDFGIGSLLVENEGESLVDTMSTANTLTSGLDCSSPESIMEPTNRTPAGDQYSLGCLIYYCLAGRYPFPDGTAVEKMMAHQFKQPTPLREVVPGLPDGLVMVVDRLMQKSPDSRFGSCEEVVEALAPYAVDHTARRPAGLGSQHGGLRGAGSNHGRNPQPARPSAPPAPAPQSPVFSTTPSSVQMPTPSQPIEPPFRSASPSGPAMPVYPAASASAFPSAAGFVPPAPAPSLPGAGVRGSMPVSRATFAAPTQLPPSAAPVAPPASAFPSAFGNEQVPAFADPHAAAYPGGFPQVTPTAPLPANRQMPGSPVPPGWVEQPRTPVFGPMLIFLIAALVTALVYVLGKNFIFPQM